MSWILALKQFTNDTVRQVQFFMVCRQLGIIFGSIVFAWYLPVDEVGIVEMLMFAGYLMTFFWSDALLRGYLSLKLEKTESGRITSFFTLYFLAGCAAMILLVAGQRLLIPLFISRSDLQGLEMFALYQVLVIPLWVAPFLGMLKGQNILLASFYVLIGPAFGAWTGFTSIQSIEGVLLGLFCYALVGFVWVLTKTKFIRRLELGKMLSAIWPVAWPLTLYAVSNGLARSFDAWLVARHFDESTFAIFRYGAREFPLVVALSAGLSAVMITKLFDHSSLEELKLRSTRVMHSSYPIVAMLLLLSPWLFEAIYGEAYLPSAAIFNIYLLLTLTQLVFPQSILMARGGTKLLWYISICELAINIVVSIVLLRYMGLPGIAWGTLVAFVFEKIALFYFINKKYNITPSMIFNVRVWWIYASVLVVIYILSKWLFGI